RAVLLGAVTPTRVQVELGDSRADLAPVLALHLQSARVRTGRARVQYERRERRSGTAPGLRLRAGTAPLRATALGAHLPRELRRAPGESGSEDPWGTHHPPRRQRDQDRSQHVVVSAGGPVSEPFGARHGSESLRLIRF